MHYRPFSCFLVAVILICSMVAAFPSQGLAGAPDTLYISRTGSLDTDAILMMNVKGKHYLFLPCNIDLSSYKVCFDSETLTINDEVYTSGQTTASVFKKDEVNEIVFTSGKSNRRMTLSLMFSSDLPSMYITTESGSLDKIHFKKTNKEPGNMILYDTDGKSVYNGGLKHMKMRGNASVEYRKKNYAIKLENGANLLGMGKAKKWILIGNGLDKSFLRNQFNFAMARYAGLQYTPDCRQISLYVNNNYMGMFLLTEKIEIDDDRVDIRDLEKETEDMNDQELENYKMIGNRYIKSGNVKFYDIPEEPDDCTGGYIIEFEHLGEKYATEPSAYYTSREMCLVIQSPEYCTEAQIKYISSFMQGFENAIFAPDGKDPESGMHYSSFVDFDSLVNKFLVNEVSKNYDSNMSSEYFYKPDDSVSKKAYAGPVWDLDNTYGDYSRKDNEKILSPKGFIAAKGSAQDYWWPALYKQQDFYKAVVDRYYSTFVPAMEILLGQRAETDILKSLDTYAAAIKESADMEYVLYPALKYKQGTVQTGENFEQNIDYLKNYITERMAWLSGQWSTEQSP